MTIKLTVTSKGQITLRKEVLKHLGVKPGDKLDVDLLNGGRMQLQSRQGTPISTVFGLLKRPNGPRLSIEQINDATAAGWAGER